MARNYDNGRRIAKVVAQTNGHDIGSFRWHDEPQTSAFPAGAFVARCHRCAAVLLHANEEDGLRNIRWLLADAAQTSSGPAHTIPRCPGAPGAQPQRVQGT